MALNPSQFIKQTASALGFSYCGISEASFLEEHARPLEAWLKSGKHGRMAWLENHFDKRLDPRQLVPGAKSIISLMYNYFPSEVLEGELRIARYAYGEDYHFVIKDLLKIFMEKLRVQFGQIEGRVFVDSAPVMERAWAAKSGLGWIGKNSLLLNKEKGSYFFLAELIIDLPLEADGPVKDYCGTCTACQDACPTNALQTPYVVDADKCISYFTIELKEEIPSEFSGKFENWIFGCDICQEVCPWNRFSQPHQQPRFDPSGDLIEMKKEDWIELTEEVFSRVFENSPLQRTGYEGMRRNIRFVTG